MSSSKIRWRSLLVRYVASKPGAAYSWTWPCSSDGSMSKKMAIPSSKPARPTPHWSMSARARLSVSAGRHAVVDQLV